MLGGATPTTSVVVVEKKEDTIMGEVEAIKRAYETP